LFSAYGLGDVMPREGMDPSEALKAPQATLMSAVAIGVFLRDLPWEMIGIGAALAVAIIIVDKALEARESSFRAPVLAVAVGIYLPLELSVPIFAGGLVAHAASRAMTAARFDAASRASASRRGLLFASGLITGEALVGILLAVPFAAAQNTDVLTLPVHADFGPMADALGGAAFVFFAMWLLSVAKRPT
jgi:putative OPT family oligopeptide transporter